jgi:hypothetical protein
VETPKTLAEAWATGCDFVFFTRSRIEQMRPEWRTTFDALFGEFMATRTLASPLMVIRCDVEDEADDATANAIRGALGLALTSRDDAVHG